MSLDGVRVRAAWLLAFGLWSGTTPIVALALGALRETEVVSVRKLAAMSRGAWLGAACIVASVSLGPLLQRVSSRATEGHARSSSTGRPGR